jgi:hypothetical protein
MLVTSIRRICQKSESLLVVGPTGSAAFNAGGTRCHHGLCLPFRPDDGEISDKLLRNLRQKLEWTVALIADKRSIISSSVLLQMELHCRHGAYHGQKSDLLWGGIPLVILVGDDYQLPSVEPGMLYCCDTQPPANTMVATGQKLFCEFAQNVMELDSSKQQHEDQAYLKEILRKFRAEEHGPEMIEEDAKFLCQIGVNDIWNFSDNERTILENDENTLFLLTNCIPVENHNKECLHREHLKEKPVAIIKPVITASLGRQIGHTKHFQRNNIHAPTKVCIRS